MSETGETNAYLYLRCMEVKNKSPDYTKCMEVLVSVKQNNIYFNSRCVV